MVYRTVSYGVDVPDDLFVEIIDLLEHWHPTQSKSSGTVGDRLQNHLRMELNGTTAPVWGGNVVEQRFGAGTTDVVVNGTIGIKLMSGSGQGVFIEAQRSLKMYARSHTYLIFYFIGNDAKSLRRYRWFQRRATASFLKVSGVACIRTAANDAGKSLSERTSVKPTGRFGEFLDRFRAPMTAEV